jgi:hypothetical protein
VLLLAQLLSGQRIDATGGLVPVGPAAFRHAWQMLRSKYPQDFGERVLGGLQ